MKNIILCGGSGTRLWPLSRKLMPKQFVKIFDGKSLFQKTVLRNSHICDEQIIVSNSEQYFLALDQMDEINQNRYRCILEPMGRNTAPAIALACLALGREEVVLVTPSDHLIKNEVEYEKVLKRAMKLAEEDHLVTFGIVPSYPEIGFGYIEADGEDVLSFKEKPEYEVAKNYLELGNYYWNSGMFCFKVGVFLDELEKYSSEIYESCKIAFDNQVEIQKSQMRIKTEDMLNIPSNSIDYAVMEKSKRVKVIPSDIQWSDMGSFDSLATELPNDKSNNLIISKKTVELIDVEDLIVVDTSDALLISKKGSSQKVKEIVERLQKEGSPLPDMHLTGYRPWGSYTVLENGNGYKIKKIVVKPGERLSLQKHFHRNEHWIVVSGTATVINGNETIILRPNESTYIKMGETHRLSNEGKIPVIMIEVQVGEYTGEDDIVRLEDDYKRD